MKLERVIGVPGGDEQILAARRWAGLSMYGRCAGEVLWPVDAKRTDGHHGSTKARKWCQGRQDMTRDQLASRRFVDLGTYHCM
jgi:hypothetical protein